MAESSKSPPSARSRIRAWIKREGEGKTEISLPDLAELGVEHFSKDAALIKALYSESLRGLIYEIAQVTYAESRVLMGDLLVPKDGVTRRSREVLSRWAMWLENLGPGQSKRLWEMTRTELRQAIALRQKRVDAELGVIALWERLIEGMETDAETVGQRFTADEIDALRDRILAERGMAAATA